MGIFGYFLGAPGPLEILLGLLCFGSVATLLLILVLLIVLRKNRPNLYPCPDCGQRVSRAASVCPHCGRPLSIEADLQPPSKLRNR